MHQSRVSASVDQIHCRQLSVGVRFGLAGAPAELYERPGPPPHDYLPKKLSRPQSAITRRTVVSSSALEDADDPVLVFAETSPFRAGAPENASPPSSPNKGAEAQGNPADIA